MNGSLRMIPRLQNQAYGDILLYLLCGVERAARIPAWQEQQGHRWAAFVAMGGLGTSYATLSRMGDDEFQQRSEKQLGRVPLRGTHDPGRKTASR